MTDHWSQLNEVSGNVQMRISNSLSMEGAAWQPVVPAVPWTLDCEVGETCTVYAQFMDSAGNESLIVDDSILLTGDEPGANNQLFLPNIRK
jgi:hypothetical protein